MLFASLDRLSIGGGKLIRRGCLRSEHWALMKVGTVFFKLVKCQSSSQMNAEESFESCPNIKTRTKWEL